jgi:hypothetical protein
VGRGGGGGEAGCVGCVNRLTLRGNKVTSFKIDFYGSSEAKVRLSAQCCSLGEMWAFKFTCLLA